jgi:hypothetical protein
MTGDGYGNDRRTMSCEEAEPTRQSGRRHVLPPPPGCFASPDFTGWSRNDGEKNPPRRRGGKGELSVPPLQGEGRISDAGAERRSPGSLYARERRSLFSCGEIIREDRFRRLLTPSPIFPVAASTVPALVLFVSRGLDVVVRHVPCLPSIESAGRPGSPAVLRGVILPKEESRAMNRAVSDDARLGRAKSRR